MSSPLITKNQDPQEKLLRKEEVDMLQFDKNRETILEANPNGQTTNNFNFAINLSTLLGRFGIVVQHVQGPALEDCVLQVSPDQNGDRLTGWKLAPENDLQFRGRVEHECGQSS